MKVCLSKVLLLFFALHSLEAYSQKFEVGGFFGISGYMGDLQLVQVEVLELHKTYGIFSRYHLSDVFGLKLGLTRGTLSGNDSNYATIKSRKERNLSFRSPVFEIGLLLETYFLTFGDSEFKKGRAYLFSGLSGFHFDPQAYYEGEWIRLQPLGTEGQGLRGYPAKYKLYQFAIPFGGGFKFSTSKTTSVGISLGLRYTFTDYLDDVSTKYPNILALAEENKLAAILSYRTPEINESNNLNPEGTNRGSEANDWYFFGGLEITISIFNSSK